MPMKAATRSTVTITTTVESRSSSRVGQLTLLSSPRTSFPYSRSWFIADIAAVPSRIPARDHRAPHRSAAGWQARQDLNLQPPVLETGALPIELLAYTRQWAS